MIIISIWEELSPPKQQNKGELTWSCKRSRKLRKGKASRLARLKNRILSKRFSAMRGIRIVLLQSTPWHAGRAIAFGAKTALWYAPQYVEIRVRTLYRFLWTATDPSLSSGEHATDPQTVLTRACLCHCEWRLQDRRFLYVPCKWFLTHYYRNKHNPRACCCVMYLVKCWGV